MKILSIGRDDNCNIILSDSMVSRRHAILKIYATGKMEIISLGQNGTFVNGVKLKSDTVYPITRKDIVSFAHVRQLDWAQIPNVRAYYYYGIMGACFVALLIGCIVALSRFMQDDPAPIVDGPQLNEVEVPVSEKQEQIPNKEEKNKTEKDTSSSDKKKKTSLPPNFFPNEKSKDDKAKDKKDKSKKEESDSKSEQSVPPLMN